MATETKSNYSAEIQSKILLNALNTHKFADVTFIIGEKQTEYNINRIFLSLISPVFNAMLFGQMKESEPNSDVIIVDIKPETFESIINFAYCNDPKISQKNVFLLIKASDKYQIASLLKVCHEYIRSDLNKTNFCTYCNEAIALNAFNNDVFQIIDKYFSNNWKVCLNGKNFCNFFGKMVELNFPKFFKRCQQFLQKSYYFMIKKILKDNDFVKLGLKAMRLFLETQPLECSEEALWTAVLKWSEYQSTANVCNDVPDADDIKHDDGNINDVKPKEYRSYLLKSVRDLIRFGLMNGKYFAEFVEPENVLNDKELISVLLYYQQPDRGCGSFETALRTATVRYTFEMSSKMSANYSIYTYDRLMNRDLTKGCGTKQQKNPWIQATFDNIVHITTIEVGAFLGKGWGSAYLNGAGLDKYDNEKRKWVFMGTIEVSESSIHALRVGVKTDAIRISKDGYNYLGIGYLKCIGPKVSEI